MAKIIDASVDISPSGEISEILKIASAGSNWTAARKRAFDRLHGLLAESNSVFFNGHCETYGLQTKGSSAVFRVPVGQRGNLSSFRGQLVLVICVDYDALWPQFSGRQFAAVPINAAGEIIISTLGKTGQNDFKGMSDSVDKSGFELLVVICQFMDFCCWPTPAMHHNQGRGTASER